MCLNGIWLEALRVKYSQTTYHHLYALGGASQNDPTDIDNLLSSVFPSKNELCFSFQIFIRKKNEETQSIRAQMNHHHHHQGPAPPDVIVLGGWSPGPLVYLQDFLATNQCRIVELQIPMPPIPGSWCRDKSVCGTIGVLILMIVCLASYGASDLQWFLFAFVVFPIWCRILAAIVVRVSIQQGMQIAKKAIRENEGRDTIVVGFSWGAAVSC